MGHPDAHPIDPEPPADPEAVERWTGSPTAERGRRRKDLRLLSGDGAILALGLTFPADEAPLDARLWREVEDGWEWLAADPLSPTDQGGAFLFAPPRVGGGYLTTWPPGRYRAEWLGAERHRRGHASASPVGSPPARRASPAQPPDRTLPSPLQPGLRGSPTTSGCSR